MEAELFGHVKGAFTGSVADNVGKVPMAESGTMFLDEIGELPLELQPKLLRLLQERTYERLGDPRERHADVRVIAATNRDIDREVREGRFRRDLFERLNYVPVRVPPLRERREDIPLILRHCLDETDTGRWIELEGEAERWLVELDFSWPGNVRHLEQLAARITLDPPRGRVSADGLRRLLDATESRTAPEAASSAAPRVPEAAPAAAAPSPQPDLDAGLPHLLEEAERSWLEAALRAHPGLTRAELAARLKISESALYRKMKQYGLGS